MVGRNAGTIPRSGVQVFPTGQTSRHKSQEARGLGPSRQGKNNGTGGAGAAQAGWHKIKSDQSEGGNGKARVARGGRRQGHKVIPNCDMEHRTWLEELGALTKCSHILGWKERRYYSAQRSAGVPNGTDKLRGGVIRQNPAAEAHRQHKQKNGPGPWRRMGCCGCTEDRPGQSQD